MKKGRQTLAEYIEERRELGFSPRKIAGVAGKTIEWISCGVDEGESPMVDIQFDDGTAMLFRLEVALKVAPEWRRNVGGELEPIRDKEVFE
jgi:hypothetical protein